MTGRALDCPASRPETAPFHRSGLNAMPRLFLLLGAINGFLTVALGAFAAHALKPRIEPALYTVFQTGVDYQALHAAALLAVGLLTLHHRSRWLLWSGALFTLGTLLF
jgi:uncharacterized membrane protein YgdD (TMEM256/DUF423 family)